MCHRQRPTAYQTVSKANRIMSSKYEYIRLESPLKKEPQPDISYELYNAIIPEEVKKRTQNTTSAINPDDAIIAVGARLNGEPVGIAIATANKIINRSEARTFFVRRDHPFEEVATGLISKMLEELKRENVKTCTFTYLQEDLETPKMEKILKATGWEDSRLFMLRCTFDAANFNPAWINYSYHYPKGFQEHRWTTLTKKDRLDLQMRETQHHFHFVISPFLEEEKIEPTNSLILKNRDTIAGWIITHRLNKDTIRYSSFYLDPAYRNQELGIKLLTDSILLQIHSLQSPSPILWAEIEIPYLYVHRLWIQFIKKRLLPHAVKVSHLLESWHKLN